MFCEFPEKKGKTQVLEVKGRWRLTKLKILLEMSPIILYMNILTF